MTKFKNLEEHKKELMEKSKESLVELYLQSKWELAMAEDTIKDLHKHIQKIIQVIKDVRTFCCENQVFCNQSKEDKIITQFCDELICLIDQKINLGGKNE